jgi:hypothetical protein
MKKDKLIYWVFTSIIVLFDSVVPALTSHTELAKQGISHLGYPDYFRSMLTAFKIAGGILLIVPAIPPRLKELAYAGFGFNFISAFISLLIVDGLAFQTFFPLIVFGILAVSYIYYRKLQQERYKVRFA